MGGLQLDSKEHLMAGGKSGPVVVPGDPDSSRLVNAVSYTRAVKMPPSGKLSDADLAALRKWIQDGAHWGDDQPAAASAAKFQIRPDERAFWSFQPVRHPQPPEVKDKTWPQTPVDRFILARLVEKGLVPNPKAEKRVLLRRLAFDLTGLPPTPDEVSAFLEDASADAESKIVNRLLASPHFGERWGRYWLDVARYGDDDARGVKIEPYPNAWRYRDWVVQAYNTDMPYDQLVKAQIAADLIEPAGENKLKAALGFFALGPWHYDIAMPPEARANERNDRIDTLTRGFLGLTVACARCHDHKYDPISTADYYALAGVFASTEYHEYPVVPEHVVQEYKAAQEQFKKQQDEAKQFEQTASDQLVSILAAQIARYMVAAWDTLHAADPAVVAQRDGLDQEVLKRWAVYLGQPTHDHPYLMVWERMVKQGATPGEVRKAAEDVQALFLSILAEKEQIDAEKKVLLAQVHHNKRIVFPNGFSGEYCSTCNLRARSLDRDRYVFWRDLAGAKSPRFDQIKHDAGVMVFDGSDLERFLGPLWQEHMRSLTTGLERAEKALPNPYPFVMGLAEAEKPLDMQINLRGSPYNLGETVPRRFLAVLSTGDPVPFRQGSGRMELADAIVHHPLTARVIVNRIWQHLFGAGLVRSTSNFGQFGDRPSHPELLDYLASELIAHGWSQKWLIRQIVLSRVYQSTSDMNPTNQAVDGDNRLLWRTNRRRLDAESLRDALLSVAGDLDLSLGGAPARLDPNHHRRTIYGKVSRFQPDDDLMLFDFPSPTITSERREVTIVPLQRLFLLNSELVQQQAELLAERLHRNFGEDDASRIRAAYRLLFAREASRQEIDIGLRFLEHAVGDAQTTLPPWTRYAQVLLASNEFSFLD
jgi:hypothetical protein